MSRVNLIFANTYLLVAGMRRHTRTRSRSHRNRWTNRPTWISTYLLFASELVSPLTSIHTSPPDDGGLDKNSMDPTYFVDIKSEGLRNILRTVLRDIHAVNLNEDKPTVQTSPSHQLEPAAELNLGRTKSVVQISR